MRALVVDDDKVVRSALTSLLRQAGFEVKSAADGREGLAALAAWPCQLVVVDWRMPVLDGGQFVAALRAQRRYDQTKVVLLSSHIDETDAAQLTGVDVYLHKPLRKVILSACLDALGFVPVAHAS